MQDTLGCDLDDPGRRGRVPPRGRRSKSVACSLDTLAEDTDLTIAIGRAGWRMVYEERAVAWTEAPATLSQLWRQRFRWTYGTMQAVWKHRRSLRQRGASRRTGWLGLGHIGVFQVLFPLAAPLVDVFFVYGLFFLDPATTLVLWFSVLAAADGGRGVRVPPRRRAAGPAVAHPGAAAALPAADVRGAGAVAGLGGRPAAGCAGSGCSASVRCGR